MVRETGNELSDPMDKKLSEIADVLAEVADCTTYLTGLLQEFDQAENDDPLVLKNAALEIEFAGVTAMYQRCMHAIETNAREPIPGEVVGIRVEKLRISVYEVLLTSLGYEALPQDALQPGQNDTVASQFVDKLLDSVTKLEEFTSRDHAAQWLLEQEQV